MTKEEIQRFNEFFDKRDEDRSFFTYRRGKEYSVHTWDIEAFIDFLTKEFPNVADIECMVGKNGIWFWGTSLEEA